MVMEKENIELENLKAITEEEKEESRLLNKITAELDKLIYGKKVVRVKQPMTVKKAKKPAKKLKAKKSKAAKKKVKKKAVKKRPAKRKAAKPKRKRR